TAESLDSGMPTAQVRFVSRWISGHGTGGPLGRFRCPSDLPAFYNRFMRNVCFRVAVAVLGLARGLLAAQAPVAAPKPVLDSIALDAWLDSLVPRALKEGDIAGAVVVVVQDGKVLVKRGFGFADVGRRVAMDPDRTVLPVGSVSKLFTWTAVMQQVQRGKLRLDRDINEYLDFTIPP